MKVEVAYALPERQWLVSVEVQPGSSALDAARAAVDDRLLPSLEVGDCVVGIFGKKVAPEHVLRSGDRVEIHRPLKADPKEVRRVLAAAGRTMGQR